MRTGCQWNRMSKRDFPNDRAVHRAFQRWVRLGIFARIWAALVNDGDELGGVDWAWQAADGALGKARFGGIRSVPTPPTVASVGRRKASWSKLMVVP